MISVVNKEFFTMRRHTVITKPQQGLDAPEYTTLISLHTDPKNAKLFKYEKEAFLSYTFKSSIDPNTMTDEDIYELMEMYDVNSYNMYTDKEYDNIVKMFPSDLRFPSIIFEKTSEYTARNMCLLAMPIKGIVPIIKKSENYKLYNGSLVVCKMFKYQLTPDAEFEFYKKILYVLAEVTTAFLFHEYILTGDQMYGAMNTHGIFLTTTSVENRVTLGFSTFKYTSLVPYKDRREQFFMPKDPNIFKLSDVPFEVYAKKTELLKDLGIIPPNNDPESN